MVGTPEVTQPQQALASSAQQEFSKPPPSESPLHFQSCLETLHEGLPFVL